MSLRLAKSIRGWRRNTPGFFDNSSANLLQTRHSLLRRLKDWNDHAGWEEFFNLYWKLLYSVAVKAGLTDAEAQDVVQDTIMVVAKKIKDFEVGSEHGSFKNWLLKITRSRIVDHFRKRARGPVAQPNAESDSCTPWAERVPDPESVNLEAIWEENWRHNLLETAMERVRKLVRPTSYQMFDLHVLKQWPASKVADQLGVTMGQVYFAKYKISRLIKQESRRLERKAF